MLFDHVKSNNKKKVGKAENPEKGKIFSEAMKNCEKSNGCVPLRRNACWGTGGMKLCSQKLLLTFASHQSYL